MLEMGAVVMGRGIASAPPPGNRYGPLSRAFVHFKLISLTVKNRYARIMSSASISPTAARRRRKLSIRRLAAWLAACAVDPKRGLWLVIGLAAVHAVLWTLILVRLKAGQDVHMDVAEAYAWGQKFLFGYGKHPPLSGWVAGVWFKIFPVTDWATYALAMATLGCGLVICWFVALRVVDRRRAFFVVLMLALYPIFNFKGFKYNPDLLQLVTMPLLVLAYLDAFAKRSIRSGALLGLAGALALMTKYWALTMIGAIGLAALIHPARLQFLRSPAPWVAIVTLVVAMLPHLIWLMQVNFAPLDLCRRILCDHRPRHDQRSCAGLCRAQSGAARVARRARSTCAGLAAAAVVAVCLLEPRSEFVRQCRAGAQRLDHPGGARDRAAARRDCLHGLHQDRLGHPAVLPGAARAGRDTWPAAARGLRC